MSSSSDSSDLDEDSRALLNRWSKKGKKRGGVKQKKLSLSLGKKKRRVIDPPISSQVPSSNIPSFSQGFSPSAANNLSSSQGPSAANNILSISSEVSSTAILSSSPVPTANILPSSSAAEVITNEDSLAKNIVEVSSSHSISLSSGSDSDNSSIVQHKSDDTDYESPVDLPNIAPLSSSDDESIVQDVTDDSDYDSPDDGATTNDNGGGGGDPVKSFSTYDEFETALRQMEVDTFTRHTMHTEKAGFQTNTGLTDYINTLKSSKKDVMLRWKCENKNEKTNIKFSGVPFVILNSRSYKCHQGKDKNKSCNDKKKQKKLNKLTPASVSEHAFPKQRYRKQPTKKQNCPVQFSVKKVLYFPSHQISIDSTTYAQKKMAAKLKQDLANLISSNDPLISQDQEVSPGAVQANLAFVTKFPKQSDHFGYHHLGEAAGIVERLDPRVQDYIKSLAKSGATSHNEILRRTSDFVAENTELDSNNDFLRRRFKPKHKVITNIIASVRNDSMHSKIDQENVMKLKNKWEGNANISFDPKGSNPQFENLVDQLDRLADGEELDELDEEWEDVLLSSKDQNNCDGKLCFVYQSENMQRLYQKYGAHLVLLDATHKTMKYALPLYFLVVQSNVNFQVVGIIVLEEESADLLIKALSKVKEWSPDIKPKYGMTDFDDAETLALEAVFPGILLFLCDFHREQAWRRWGMKNENGVSHIYDFFIARLRRVAKALTPTECDQAIEDLRSWENFNLIEKYFNSTWLPELQRWSRAYRPDDLFKCNTNNGTERINEVLKHNYLKKYKQSTLSQLMTILIEQFIPERYEQYVELNIAYTSGSKAYDSNIPSYMVNRPGPLVDDMLTKRARVTDFMKSSVYPVLVYLDQKAYWVESINPQSNERHTYLVHFGTDENICSCQCGSFRHNRVLCKHFFAIFESGKGKFEELSSIYLHHPYTNIDNFVLGGAPLPLVNPIQDISEVTPSEEEPIPFTFSSLPPRRKSGLTTNRRKLLSDLKVLSEKIYLTNSEEGIQLIQEQVSKAMDAANEVLSRQLGENSSDSTLITHDNHLPSYPAVPPRRYEAVPISNVTNVTNVTNHQYTDLPVNKGKQKHPYGNRFGEKKEMMMKNYKINVPIPKPPPKESNVIVDGTVDMENTSNIGNFENKDDKNEDIYPDPCIDFNREVQKALTVPVPEHISEDEPEEFDF